MDTYRVKPGSKVDLSRWDPNDTNGFKGGKQDSQAVLDDLTKRLTAQQELLYAEHQHKLLVILQGMDTSGKDGTIQHVFSGVNPSGVRVASFKVPSLEELDHDYLWRIHKQVPGKGEMVIFNRSQYEDVLIVRVHNLVPEEVWSQRYDQINNFEKILSETGTTILKFYLNISKEEQKNRLEARLNDPTKLWKFNPEDLKERALWEEYMTAYQDALTRTSTTWAPWFVVPSNHKWYRNLVIATQIVETLEGLKMKYPQPVADFSKIRVE